MGSPHAFEYRRQELQALHLPCTDEDVTDSFCDAVSLDAAADSTTTSSAASSFCSDIDCDHNIGDGSNNNEERQGSALPTSNPSAPPLSPPRGLMLRYLELAQVAAVIGDVMFVHGAIHEFNMG